MFGLRGIEYLFMKTNYASMVPANGLTFNNLISIFDNGQYFIFDVV